MSKCVRIALDAMGGDFGPSIVAPGAARALTLHSDMRFLFFGDEAKLRPLMERYPALMAASEIRHTSVIVKNDDRPAQAVRAGRHGSSMWLAINAVKNGEADAAVSAGNTGALMAMSKIALHMMNGVERPALAAIWPTLRGESIVLDVGATIGADATHLFDLAIMGAAMARILFHHQKPTVGLLNVGVEEIKGLEQVKEASRRLREANLPALQYKGFVEGDDLGKGTVDVVVTEGFAGNIALKTAEGTAKQINGYMRDALQRSLSSKIGAFFAQSAFSELRKRIDPRRVNGGLLLGLNGVVIKSHGGMDAIGFARAIEIGYDMVRHGLLEKIHEMLTQSSAFQNMERSLDDQQSCASPLSDA